MIIQILSMVIGSGLTLLGVWWAQRLKENSTKKTCINALKMELEENLSALANKEKELSCIIEKQEKGITESFFIHLSDFSWNNCKHVIADYGECISKKICDAYIFVGQVNIIVNASFYRGVTVHNLLLKVIKAANESLIKAREALDSLKP